jgi:hypothetical protein
MQDRIEGKCASELNDWWSAAKATQTPGTIILTTSELGEEASVLLSPEDASRLGRFLLAAAGFDANKLEAERDELRARVSLPEPSADLVEELARVGWDAEAAAIRETGVARCSWLEASEGSYYRTGIRAVISALASKGVEALPSIEQIEDRIINDFGKVCPVQQTPAVETTLEEVRVHITPILTAKDAEIAALHASVAELEARLSAIDSAALEEELSTTRATLAVERAKLADTRAALAGFAQVHTQAIEDAGAMVARATELDALVFAIGCAAESYEVAADAVTAAHAMVNARPGVIGPSAGTLDERKRDLAAAEALRVERLDALLRLAKGDKAESEGK